jgi:hypothetical protein
MLKGSSSVTAAVSPLRGAQPLSSPPQSSQLQSSAKMLLAATPPRRDGLDWDESLPVASPALQHRHVGRYFLSANATEAMRLLRPEHAITRPQPGSLTIGVDELISIAVGVLQRQRRGSSSTTEVSVAAARLYQTWSVDIQAKCFRALQRFLGDEWNCSSFLNALAPLVDFRFDSIVLTLKGDAEGAFDHHASPRDTKNADEHHAHRRPERIQMHCPQVLFDAFVAAWDVRSRHVLRVTSRHGCMTLSDVSPEFLEYIDRYGAYGSGGEGSSLVSHQSLLNAAAVTSPLGSLSRRAAMEHDVAHPYYSSVMFAKERTVPASDFSSLWARGNVLLRVHSFPFHGSAGKALPIADEEADDSSGSSSTWASIAGGTTSLPLTEWNDLVSRWNSVAQDQS